MTKAILVARARLNALLLIIVVAKIARKFIYITFWVIMLTIGQKHRKTSMCVLAILGRKYAPTASRAAPWRVKYYVPRTLLRLEKRWDRQTDRTTDARRYITVIARCGQRNKCANITSFLWVINPYFNNYILWTFPILSRWCSFLAPP